MNCRLAAVPRLAYEAADSGLLGPDLAAGILRVRDPKKPGVRLENWLTVDQLNEIAKTTVAGSQKPSNCPGLMCYGQTRDEAIRNAEKPAINVIADRIAHREIASASLAISVSIPDEQLTSH